MAIVPFVPKAVATLFACILFLTLAYVSLLFVLHGGDIDFLNIDRCLDRGGRWNYESRACETEP